MKYYLKWAGIAVVSSQLITNNGAAQDQSTADDIRALRQKIEELEKKVKALENQTKQTGEPAPKVQELEQKVKILERNRELDTEAAEARAKEAPQISIGSQGFALKSADGAFGIQLKGHLQVDSRTFFNDAGIVGNDSLLVRRVRPILQGTVFRNFDFLFVPDFAGSSPQLFDAYINYRYKPSLQLRGGKFKSPVGLEQLQSDQDTLFNERALPTSLTPNRDVGFMLNGEILEGTISYAAGIFNGVGDGRNSGNADFEDDKAFEGRLFFEPFRKTSVSSLQGFGLGVGGSYESQQRTNIQALPGTTGGILAGYATDGQQQFFAYNPTNGVVAADGDHWRLSPQGYYFHGPFTIFGEYVISNQKLRRLGPTPASARLENTGWEVSAGWVLTGEDYNYRGGVVPRHRFNPLESGWGAWQLAARYAQLDIDDKAFPLFSNPTTSASAAESWSLGLNWWLNRNVRVMTSFSHTDFKGGGGAGLLSPAVVTRKDENVLFTRLQLAF